MGKVRIDDGLTRLQRFRLKDLDSYREKQREYAKTPEQRKKRTEYMRVWRGNNREKHNSQRMDYYYRNREEIISRSRGYRLKYMYSISEEDYQRMFNEQVGVCKICGRPPYEHGKNKKSIVLHIDHDHSTNEVRGLLCSRCNGALGWYEKYNNDINNYLNKFSKDE